MENIIIGKTFNFWKILEKRNKASFLCQCICGKKDVLSKTKLKRNKSCGCMKRTLTSIIKTTHGKRHTRLYGIWAGIKKRCYNKNSVKYKNYGYRGITVFNEWKNDFISFYNWAVNNGYNNTLQIDRIDNDKGYFPSNCHFTTAQKNSLNKTTSKIWVVNGIEFRSAIKAGKFYNVSRKTISRWCDGDISRNQKPKKNCCSYKLYN